MPIKHEFGLPEDFSRLSPEEQEEWRQKEKENKMRLRKEDLEDMIYKQKQENKLLRELEQGGKEQAPTRKLTDKEQREKERKMVEEFLAKQKGEKKKKDKEEKELEELMSDPSIMVQEPPGGYKCMNMIEGKPCGEPATTKLLHGGLLGDMPPITLCKDCSKLLKLINIDFEDPEMEKRLRKKQLETEVELWEKAQQKALKKQKKEQEKGYRAPGTQSLSLKSSELKDVFKKIIDLAGKLDAKGLYVEANILDKIIKD